MTRVTAINSVEDALHLARRRLPPSIMQSFENGAGSWLTIDANVRAIEDVMFRPRGGVWMPEHDLSSSVLGHHLRLPLVASSIGALGLGHPDGEAGVARAIGAAGGLQFVSTFCSTPIEEIVAAATGPVYYQLYYVGDRAAMEAMITRAREAGCAGLVFVIDSVRGHTPARQLPAGQRRYVPAGVTPNDVVRFAPQLITHPWWALEFLRGQVPLELPMALDSDGRPVTIADARKLEFAYAPQWEDLNWIREVWDCPIIVKGVLSVDEARLAVHWGAAALVVSNHGGNRLDGTIPSLPVLPEVVEAVGGEIDVLFDGGIRRGTDVIKALALGAKAVGLGRAYLYPLIAGGEAGVRRILEVFARDMESTLAFLGCASIAELTPEHLALPASMRVTV